MITATADHMSSNNNISEMTFTFVLSPAIIRPTLWLCNGAPLSLLQILILLVQLVTYLIQWALKTLSWLFVFRLCCSFVR